MTDTGDLFTTSKPGALFRREVARSALTQLLANLDSYSADQFVNEMSRITTGSTGRDGIGALERRLQFERESHTRTAARMNNLDSRLSFRIIQLEGAAQRVEKTGGAFESLTALTAVMGDASYRNAPIESIRNAPAVLGPHCQQWIRETEGEEAWQINYAAPFTAAHITPTTTKPASSTAEGRPATSTRSATHWPRM